MTAVRRALHATAGAVLRPVLDRWDSYTRLFTYAAGPAWVIHEEMRELATIARRLGVRVPGNRLARHARRQAIFFGSHFDLLSSAWIAPSHRLATAYFHGRPGSDVPEFDEAFAWLRRSHARLDRVQVSHREALEFVCQSGIDPAKVHVIPIGINLAYFPPATPASRAAVRRELGLPDAAVVVGSFQKDGVGWGDGAEPKLVKGPDVLLAALRALKAHVPTLHVLLTGPARGYVRRGLAEAGIPFVHRNPPNYAAIGRLFHALDVYIVASRQEGGPKAILESMAAGVPLVTTRVGQAMDLVRHGENGWMVPVEDVEGLVHWAATAVGDAGARVRVTAAGRLTAEANAYERQDGAWRRLLDGFVALAPAGTKGEGSA